MRQCENKLSYYFRTSSLINKKIMKLRFLVLQAVGHGHELKKEIMPLKINIQKNNKNNCKY